MASTLELMKRIRAADAEIMRQKDRVVALEADLKTETERRRRAQASRDRANQVCDHLEKRVEFFVSTLKNARELSASMEKEQRATGNLWIRTVDRLLK